MELDTIKAHLRRRQYRRATLDSSTLSVARFIEATDTLVLEFTNGRVYAYLNVPEQEYRRLVAAESAGKYFHAHIKDQYAFKRVLHL